MAFGGQGVESGNVVRRATHGHEMQWRLGAEHVYLKQRVPARRSLSATCRASSRLPQENDCRVVTHKAHSLVGKVEVMLW